MISDYRITPLGQYPLTFDQPLGSRWDHMGASTSKRVSGRNPKAKNVSSWRSRAMVVIDDEWHFRFDSVKQAQVFFQPVIETIEKEVHQTFQLEEIPLETIEDLEARVTEVIENPLQIWERLMPFDKAPDGLLPVYVFLGYHGDLHAWHVIWAHMNQDQEVTWIHYQLMTMNQSALQTFLKDELVFDHRLNQYKPAIVDGDGLSQADPLALGLFEAHLKLRQPDDIPLSDFGYWAQKLRDLTIQNPDEMRLQATWQGVNLLNLIRWFPEDDEEPGIYYVVVTVKEPYQEAFSILFSFPTRDESLVDRYRQGELVQESGESGDAE